jgi:hypothetical protein
MVIVLFVAEMPLLIVASLFWTMSLGVFWALFSLFMTTVVTATLFALAVAILSYCVNRAEG